MVDIVGRNNTFTVDGKTFTGNSIIIRNGQVIVDGVVQDGTVHGVVEVRIVEGKVQNVTSDASISCGDVGGNVKAGMGVNCGSVGGNVDAGMSVNCGDVHGSVDAGMNVRKR